MIETTIHIDRYNWRVLAFLDADCQDTDRIADALTVAGCGGEFLQRAVSNIASCNLDQGLCYSADGESVLVVSRGSGPAQVINSIAHECFHLVNHICERRGVDIASEDAAYLMGDVVAELWKSLS